MYVIFADARDFESVLFAFSIVCVLSFWIWRILRERPGPLEDDGPRPPCALTVEQFQVIRDAVRDVAFAALAVKSAPASEAAEVELWQSINDLCVLVDVDPGRVLL